MSLKVAVVGCGKIADGHVEVVQKLPELAQVVAVCDLEPLMAEQLAERFGVPRHYDDFDALLEKEKPDVVHITTPPMSHKPLALRAVEAGCHVFVEKPLAPRYDEAVELVNAVEQAGKKLCIGYMHHYDPAMIALREMIAQGELGEPVHIESYYGYSLAGDFGKALMATPDHWVHRLPGKLLHNTIDHIFYKLTDYIHDDRPEIIATGNRLRPQRFGDERDDLHDELRLIVRGEKVTAYGTFSSFAQPMAHYMRIHGTKNTAQIDFTSRTVTMLAHPTLPSALGRLGPAFETAMSFAREGVTNVMRFARSEFHFFAGFIELFRRYYRSILDGTPPPYAHRDMLRVSRMLEDTWACLEAEDARRNAASSAGRDA